MVMTIRLRPPQPLRDSRSSRLTAFAHSSWPLISVAFPLRATVLIRVILNPLMPVVWYNGIVCIIFLSELALFKKGHDSKSRLKQRLCR
jgi:hypothetical protein